MHKMLEDVFNAVMSCPLGDEINFEASKMGDDYIQFHYWDGRRFMLTLVQEQSSFGYDVKTGFPISTEEDGFISERQIALIEAAGSDFADADEADSEDT